MKKNVLNVAVLMLIGMLTLCGAGCKNGNEMCTLTIYSDYNVCFLVDEDYDDDLPLYCSYVVEEGDFYYSNLIDDDVCFYFFGETSSGLGGLNIVNNPLGDGLDFYKDSEVIVVGNEWWTVRCNEELLYLSTNEDGSGEKYYPGDTITLDSDVTLYAKFQHHDYSVMYYSSSEYDSRYNYSKFKNWNLIHQDFCEFDKEYNAREGTYFLLDPPGIRQFSGGVREISEKPIIKVNTDKELFFNYEFNGDLNSNGIYLKQVQNDYAVDISKSYRPDWLSSLPSSTSNYEHFYTVNITIFGENTDSANFDAFFERISLYKSVRLDLSNVTGVIDFSYIPSNVISIVVPDTMNSMDGLLGSSSLEITFTEQNLYFCMKDNMIYSKDYKKIFYCSNVQSEDFTIPSGVTDIGNYAFYHCGIRAVTIPASVVRIGKYAFKYAPNYDYSDVNNVYFEDVNSTWKFISDNDDSFSEYVFSGDGKSNSERLYYYKDCRLEKIIDSE